MAFGGIDGGIHMKQSDIVVKCCRCHRVRLEGQWQHEDHEEPDSRRYSHSYCPACLTQVHADLETCEALAG